MGVISQKAVWGGLPPTGQFYEAGRRYGHVACRRLGLVSTGLFLDRPMC
jgi:hypothetical protein